MKVSGFRYLLQCRVDPAMPWRHAASGDDRVAFEQMLDEIAARPRRGIGLDCEWRLIDQTTDQVLREVLKP